MNNRFGIYTYRDIDIFERAKNILKQDILSIATKTLKNKLIELINEKSQKSSNLKVYMETFEYQINNDYKTISEDIPERVKEYINLNVFSPLNRNNEFWNYVIARWSHGSGYTIDVLDKYKHILNESDIKEFILNEMTINWNIFKSNVLELFS
ncbi:hypothetical protein [Clostridium estertheticum]|uniref:Uncharacterized protein n=1 Tax=Clostridium estertheticum TaxID=238834 RepID=A0AA47EG47_9CLOT|nr:hypothetical protein [Clostridium estertheticum]MBU3155000.1 hypothetical protein [Clostridium estertheticum]WAG58819.1 hypothetical protein LL038_14270 [Clostridium estertheticum]